MNKISTLSVVGLGKLGSPMAAFFACRGYDVIGLDLNAEIVSSINEGKAPFEEPQLQNYIDQSKNHIRATCDYQDAILNSDVSFIILPTPSMEDGFFSNDYLVDALGRIGQVLRQKSAYHLVVVTSTVMPGSMDGILRNAIEASSGRTIGENLGFCYHPEFIALGNIINNMLKPDFILIGESDKKAADLLEVIYTKTCAAPPIFRRMNFVNAELAKIAINTYVTTKISYANMLAEMCDYLAGADVDIVTNAVGSDTRVGTKYLKGALGYGGPCFPRDNKAFSALGDKLGVRCDLTVATDNINNHQIARMLGIIEGAVTLKSKIAILGLSYKPDTDVIDESQGVALATSLSEAGYDISVYDPMANENARKFLPQTIIIADTLADCVISANLIVIMTPWPEFGALKSMLNRSTHKNQTIVDPWRTLDHNDISENMKLLHLGVGSP